MLYASGFVAYFFNVILLMGLAAIIIVGQNPEFFEGGKIGGKIVGGGNMVAMHLAKAVGGNLLLGFLSAVAFATILAVVSGLALAGAASISHDIYARVITQGQGHRDGRAACLQARLRGPGHGGHRAGHRLREENVAFMVGLAFGIAASAQLPGADPVHVLEGPDHPWRAWPAATSAWVAAVLFVLSKSVWVTVLGKPGAAVPVRPAGAVLDAGGLPELPSSSRCWTAAPQAKKERAAFDDQFVRAQTGYGAAAASNHRLLIAFR